MEIPGAHSRQRSVSTSAHINFNADSISRNRLAGRGLVCNETHPQLSPGWWENELKQPDRPQVHWVFLSFGSVNYWHTSGRRRRRLFISQEWSCLFLVRSGVMPGVQLTLLLGLPKVRCSQLVALNCMSLFVSTLSGEAVVIFTGRLPTGTLPKVKVTEVSLHWVIT